jgi:hypothetical protein
LHRTGAYKRSIAFLIQTGIDPFLLRIRLQNEIGTSPALLQIQLHNELEIPSSNRRSAASLVNPISATVLSTGYSYAAVSNMDISWHTSSSIAGKPNFSNTRYHSK